MPHVQKTVPGVKLDRTNNADYGLSVEKRNSIISMDLSRYLINSECDVAV